MKTRVIALLLLLALATTACASETGLTKAGKNENNTIHSARSTEDAVPDPDVGTVDGNTYTHEALGFSVSFPQDGGWYLSDEDSLARDNAAVIDGYDRAAIVAAVKEGKEVRIFHATALEPEAVLSLSVAKNPLPGEDADALVDYFLPQVQAFFADAGLGNASYVPYDKDFCGEDHVALLVSNESADAPYHIAYVYLPCGELVYTLSVEAEPDTIDGILRLFEPLD